MDHFSILYMPCINFEIIQFQFNLISLEHQSSLLFLKKVGSDGKKHRGFKIDVVIQKRCHNSKDKKKPKKRFVLKQKQIKVRNIL